jgi:hypothetical protein
MTTISAEVTVKVRFDQRSVFLDWRFPSFFPSLVFKLVIRSKVKKLGMPEETTASA